MWLTDGQSAYLCPPRLTDRPKFPFAAHAHAQTRRFLHGRLEIGVALTSFGGLFMLLGIILFFDGALLALGNVRPICELMTAVLLILVLCRCPSVMTPSLHTLHLTVPIPYHPWRVSRAHSAIPSPLRYLRRRTGYSLCTADPFPVWGDADHWPLEDVPFLREETEASRDPMLHWRHPPCVLQVAVHRSHRGDIRVLKPVRVSLLPIPCLLPLASLP